MIISGDVEKIIFRNEDNGYTVVDLRSSGDYVTAVGVFPEIYEGMRLELTGDYKYHARHGLQFLAESVKVVEPDGAAAIEKFLKSGIFKGVGEVTARNIVERFGERTLDVMKTSPEKLAEVKGISAKKAAEICATLREHGEMQDTLVYLQRFDVSLNLALKIYKTYGARTEEVIKTNPYQLISDVERVGFQTADKIAQEVGITKDSDFRIRAGIIYTLKEASNKSGHTALPDDILKKELLSLLGFDETYLEKVECNIEDLIFLAEIKDYVVDNARFYMLYKSYLTEKTIARRLALLEAAHGGIEVDFSEQIDKFEEMCGIKLHEKQREAVSNSLNSGVHVITGGPGTGKTTIIKCILHILKFLKLSYQLCAPTGRAAKRMGEATGEEAKTIHRLLDLDFEDSIVFGGKRLGLYYLECGAAFRNSNVVYDREGSSFATLRPGMIDWETIFADAGWFHWSGIAAALSQEGADACREALEIADRMGLTISCDLNFRKKLWNYGCTAAEVMQPLVQYSDVIFGAEPEYQEILGIQPVGFRAVDTADVSFESDLPSFEKFGQEVERLVPRCQKVFLELRNSLTSNHNVLAAVLYSDGTLKHTGIYDIEHETDRVGAGDAFVGGMIYGLITYPDDDRKALDFALAASALKNTVYGDFNLVTVDEVESLMNGNISGRVSR